MTGDEKILPKPFAVTLAIRLLWLSLLLGIGGTSYYWPILISLMPSYLSFMARCMLLISNNVFLLSITLWLIFKVALGYNWARAILFLGFIIMVPLTIPTLIEMYYYAKIFVIISGATLFFEFVALSLLFSDSGNAWFKTQKAYRKHLARQKSQGT